MSQAHPRSIPIRKAVTLTPNGKGTVTRRTGAGTGGWWTIVLSMVVGFVIGRLLDMRYPTQASLYSLSLLDDVTTKTNARRAQPLTTTTAADTHTPMKMNHHPMLSLEPSKQSLHSKWKLWTEMTPDERQHALDEVGAYLKKYGSLITKKGATKQQKNKHGTCDMVEVGLAGNHQLCGPPPSQPCSFVSFGINDDPSFDRALAETWGCRGFAGDPTVDHPSKLHPKVTFHNIGATMLIPNEERLIDKGGDEEWWEISMPKLRYFLGMENIDIVKLDCEGCEVALARDIIREDPSYLHHVNQMSIETHVSRTWINSTEHVYYFGLHFALLEEAGFQLEWSNVFGCSKRHEVPGCMPELSTYGYPCGYKPWPRKTNVVLGYSCQDFLWKRYPK